MKTIESVGIIDPYSPYHGQCCDVVIEAGRVVAIQQKKDKIRFYLFPALTDVFGEYNGLYFPERETPEQWKQAALSGGVRYAGIYVPCETTPELFNALQQQLRQQGFYIRCYLPSVDTQGRMAPILQAYHKAGIKHVFLPYKPIEDTRLLTKLLRYLGPIDGTLFVYVFDRGRYAEAVAYESAFAMLYGLESAPFVAETSIIGRVVEVLRYTGGKVHFSGIATAKGVAWIAQAKKEGLSITADVPITHLLYDQTILKDFDARYKFAVPLGTEEDKQACLQGYLDGTIDFVASYHAPRTPEEKHHPLPQAHFGIATLHQLATTVFTLGLQHQCIDSLIERQSYQAAALLGFEPQPFKEGCDLKDFFFYHPETQQIQQWYAFT